MSGPRPDGRLLDTIRGRVVTSRWRVTRSESSKFCETLPNGMALPVKLRPALGSCQAFLGRRERTDRNAISVRISERELLGLSVRIYVWFLVEPSDERACPLKREVEVVDTEEQQEAIPVFPVIGALQ